MKIDNRKRWLTVLDTETTGKTPDGGLKFPPSFMTLDGLLATPPETLLLSGSYRSRNFLQPYHGKRFLWTKNALLPRPSM